jgi:hypothetical protein
MPSGRSAGTLGVVGKWFTAILTSFAAIIALLVNAQNLGLTSWFGATDFGFAGYAVRRIIVTPRADSLVALGDTAVLAATVTDRRGAVLIGVPLEWVSEDTMVATVDSTGAVVARGPGLARITAAVREHRAVATVYVRQQVAQVTISGDSALSLPEADSLRVSALAFDARGHRVRGSGVRWTSTDTFVVVVDSTGRVRSRAPGRAQLVASAGPVENRLGVEVRLTPFRLRLVDGGEQHAAAGRALPDPITIEVLSRSGQPVPGAEVIFASAQGMLEHERLRTDARGRVQPSWVLGNRPGPHQLRGRIAGVDSTIVISANADPTPADTRIELADSALEGTVGTTLNPPVILRLVDPDGAPLRDIAVSWTAMDGGSAAPLAPRTDSLGQAIGRWTLGRKAGKQRLRVQVGDARSMPLLTVAATARAAAPASLTVVSGADQKVMAGKAAQPIVLQLRDSLGNAVPEVKLTVTASTGSLRDSLLTSDAAGRATVRWTAGSTTATAILVISAPDSSVRIPVRGQVIATRPGKAPTVKPAVKAPVVRPPAAGPAAKKPR